jgi:ribonucleoside-diphosphate reductase alpha chain
MIFIDEINRHNKTPNLGKMTATNPCGEQPLLPNESCNLGSINLSKFVHQNDFNLDYFGEVVEDAIEFLDSVIGHNTFPTAEIEHATLQTRKLGLGVMGWADCLILMGHHYGCKDAISLIDLIGAELQVRSRLASKRLAEEFGTFPAYEGSVWSVQNMKLRNATLTTIAPTGTLSYLAKCSSGIEPIFAWKHTRESEEGIETIVNPLYDEAVSNGLAGDTAYNIHWMWQIEHQSHWQKWIDNAVSKTINLPENATVEDIEAIYAMAWEKKCKGITVYRKGSRDKEVLSDVKVVPKRSIPKGIIIRPATVYEAQSGCGTIRGIIDREKGKVFETFVLTGGGCGANNECAGRLISDEMQDGRPAWKISNTLHKVKCPNAMKNPNSVGKSCSDLLGTFIDIETAGDDLTTPTTTGPRCPECNAELEFEGGCGTGSCIVCGWSGCS